MSVLVILFTIYLAALAGHWLAFLITNYVPPKGLWKLVPFRVSGWKSHVYQDKVYKINWVWIKIDFT